jgi:protein TonB
MEQIAGEIRSSDYPRDLYTQGIGGRVDFRFTVGSSGRVTDCSITRTSGSAELDTITCRLVIQRFRFRPSTDSAGRPIAEEADGEHVWSAGRP